MTKLGELFSLDTASARDSGKSSWKTSDKTRLRVLRAEPMNEWSGALAIESVALDFISNRIRIVYTISFMQIKCFFF